MKQIKPASEVTSPQPPSTESAPSTPTPTDQPATPQPVEENTMPALEVTKPDRTPPPSRHKRLKKIILGLSIMIVFAIAASAYPIIRIATLAKSAESLISETAAAASSQDLTVAGEKLDAIHTNVASIQSNYRLLGWWQFTPLRRYYQDGNHALTAALAGVEAGQSLIGAIEPHADVLGFRGEGSFAGGTTEDRIVLILETISEITPSLDTASEKLTLAEAELTQIDPQRYQFNFRGQNLADVIIKTQDTISSGKETIDGLRPIVEILPQLAGATDKKRYLVIFQNDAELRPTGGFMTAYAVLDVEKGRVIPTRSEDIYSLDNRFTKRLAPPGPIEEYFPLVNYWYLRDMNLSPDFKVSMDTFIPYYQEVPGESEVDGVIAIDTNVLKNLVEILGPIEVAGFGEFSVETEPKCDCPQVIYKLENLITRPVAEIRTDRKAVLGPMMQTILQAAYDADSNAWPALFQTLFSNLFEKHILLYMVDDTQQEAVEAANFAGRIQDYSGDYFHINDANFGGAKSNMFVTQEVDQVITVVDGVATHDVTIIYKNPAPASNCNLEAGQLCLNGVLRDFIRFYLPKGSQLVDSAGFAADSVKTTEDLNKTAVEGFFTLEPQSQSKLKLVYTTPYEQTDEYRFLIQKQPGTYSPAYTVTLNDTHQEQFELTRDQEIIFPL